MSKIKIFALGGLNESGKNTYVVEVDENIFVFDCGLKYANDNMYGIDYIIPDYNYLIENKKRIRGIFITHAHLEQMGGVSDLINALPDVKIFATKYTKEYMVLEGVNKDNIIEIKAHKKITFGELSIFPINVSHSVPDAVMYVLNTKDGAICYTGDFLIDPTMTGSYGMDLGKVAYVGKQGVLCLLSESSFSEKKGHTSPHHRLTSWFKDTINQAEGRIIVSILPVHLYAIQELFDASINMHRKVVIMGNKLQNIIKMARENGYLNVSDDLIGGIEDIERKDSIILVCDDRKTPTGALNKIVNENDKFIHLKDTDTVLFAEPVYDDTEKTVVKMRDAIAQKNVNTIVLPKDKTVLHHASSEDLMIMLNLLNPKYYMPVKGEYRLMVNNANLADALHMPKENIILKQNGEVAVFENGILSNESEKIPINELLIDGNSTKDIGELVLKDREMLSENGIVIVCATLDKKTRKVLAGPEILTRGFIYVKENIDFINQIKEMSADIINKNISNSYVDYNKIKTDLRDVLGNFFYNETECKPMVITLINEI
jgi:ribonuclease J